MNRKNATLFIVATPIGNLADITLRAVDVLKDVDLILAEDTRRASILLRHWDIRAPVRSFHQHNEAARLPSLLRRLGGGARMALISDAGTPLISDPGYRLVRRAREQGITVTPVPGPSAAIAALSASGQPAARFCFEGFLPATAEARRRRLNSLQDEPRTLVFYESSHRISATLEAMASVFGGQRPATVAREISKRFETFYGGTLAEILTAMAACDHHRKGEFVIILSGATAPRPESRRMEEIMALLSAEMPLKRASRIASQILGANRNECYEAGVKAKRKGRSR
ncbi:MAG: 16S rRNA (cytidine(1402)-2'-O)-methyltransferase [Gammaproteobacteria bacterium]|nr:16S rRNA (cytidine(1402)-2'-O)-methyltransferase [Gammaproteobacteria bacterium]